MDLSLIISILALLVSASAHFNVWWRDRVRLEIEFKKGEAGLYSFEVRNLGRMDITISKAEMSLYKSPSEHKLCFKPQKLPYRMESISNFILYFNASYPLEDLEDLELGAEGKGYVFVYIPSRKRPFVQPFDLNC